MPLSKYYGGKGASVMKKMKSEYGAEKGERVFYATQNKMKNSKSGYRTGHRTAMGRKVVHHSPDKFPEQTDPYSQMDKDLEKALQGGPRNYQQMRERMKPMQKESPKPAQALMEYIKRMGGGYK